VESLHHHAQRIAPEKRSGYFSRKGKIKITEGPKEEFRLFISFERPLLKEFYQLIKILK